MQRGYETHQPDTEMQLSMADFMQANFEADPGFFVEPEDTPEYGPPGMPTPFVPMDARIADRQLVISDSLRGLLLDESLRAHVDQHTIDMLLMNFDAHNTILGAANNDSYQRWDMSNHEPLDPSLQRILNKGILGTATQGEIADLMLSKPAKEFKNAEYFKIYHPLKCRMRHLEPRRNELKDVLLERGGYVYEDPDYYDLKLYPYIVTTERELTAEEQRECSMLQGSIDAKLRSLGKHDLSGLDNGVVMSEELHDEITNAIENDERRLGEIMATTQLHEIKGLMGSLKRRIGIIAKDEENDILIVERQVFALDLRDIDQDVMESLKAVHSRRAVDEKSLAAYAWVYDQFKQMTERLLPVSTEAYGYEKAHKSRHSDTVTGALAKIATQSSVLLNSDSY